MRGLINLTRLEFQDTAVSDISPIAGLINLIVLKIDDTNVTDLSPIAGLINLKELHMSRTNVTDLSLVAGLRQFGKFEFFPDKSIGLVSLGRINQPKIRWLMGPLHI